MIDEREPYVGLSDVVDWVSPDDYQTSQPCESHQLRGERGCRRGREPAYTVRGGTPSGVVDATEPMGDVEYFGDVDGERLDESEIARLQSFPEWFEWTPDTVREQRMVIGNAVPPRLAESIGEVLP